MICARYGVRVFRRIESFLGYGVSGVLHFERYAGMT